MTVSRDEELRKHLRSLVGKTIYTISRRNPNRVIEIRGDEVIVSTDRSPSGQPVPIREIESAWAELQEKGELAIEVTTVGYRSAFIGAVLATLPGVVVLGGTRRLRLDRDEPQV